MKQRREPSCIIFCSKAMTRCAPRASFPLGNVPACNWDYLSRRALPFSYSTSPSTISIFPPAPASRRRLPISKGLSSPLSTTVTSSNDSPRMCGQSKMEALGHGRRVRAGCYAVEVHSPRKIKMKPISPTAHPDVNEILNRLLTNVQGILGDQFVGMYLFGSLANGDFDKHSDIDVLVVTEENISGDGFSPWAIQIEASYIPRTALRRFDPVNKLHPHMDRGDGETLHMMSHESDWIVQRHILRERGIVITGASLKTLIDPVSPNDLRQAVVNVL